MTSPAGLRSKVEALDLGALAGFLGGEVRRFDDGTTSFRCPRCRRRDLPTAWSVDQLTWCCSSCKASGTRFDVADLVLRDVVAIRRAVSELA